MTSDSTWLLCLHQGSPVSAPAGVHVVAAISGKNLRVNGHIAITPPACPRQPPRARASGAGAPAHVGAGAGMLDSHVLQGLLAGRSSANMIIQAKVGMRGWGAHIWHRKGTDNDGL